jgi:hypothetical protein
MSETVMNESAMTDARDAADQLAVVVHDATRALPDPAGRSFGQRLRGSAAAVVVLVAGACRADGAQRAERFVGGAELALRRLGREIAAAERQGLMTMEAALRLLERSTGVGVALAALEELLLGEGAAPGTAEPLAA